MKRVAFAIYSWGSTALMGALVFWLSTLEEFQLSGESTDLFIKIGFRITLYGLLFIFIYRSLIITFKYTVERLSTWRSKGEKIEDAEFVLIVETLIVVVTVLACVVIAFIDKWSQNRTINARADEHAEDLFISIFATILAAIIVYSLPVIGELEYGIKHRVESTFKNKKKTK